jgi:hypothetical protein
MPMTKDQTVRWLTSLHIVEKLMAGAVDRGTPSEKLRTSILAYLKPIVADMEAAAPAKRERLLKRERL